MTTPGAIKRYTQNAWNREGGYILSLPTLGDLPPAPDDDDVFAFVHANGVMYRSLSGSWVPYIGQAVAPLNERIFLNANANVPAVGFQKVPLNTPLAGSVNFNTSLNRWVCPVAGSYAVSAGAGITTVASTNYRLFLAVYVNGVETLRGTDYTTGTTTITGGGGTVYDVFALNVGDYVELYTYIQPSITSVAWVGLARITYMNVRAVGATGLVGATGPVGPAGAPGQPFPVYADYASMPKTGLTAGATAVTQDTGTLWAWTGTYWRPQVAASSAGQGFAGGTIPSSGTLTLATITIPAQPWPRLVTASAMLLTSSASAANAGFQLAGTHIGGGQWFARSIGPTSNQWLTLTLNAVTNTLPADTVGTLSFAASCVAGVATASANTDARFSRADWLIQPV